MKNYLLLLAICFIGTTSHAQFTNDSLLNVTIQDVTGSDQVTPLVASRADGGVYISWFDQSTGAYVLRMQRLDALGNKLWGANGVVVSNAAQNTALYRYDLKTDKAGNAIVAFQDMRTGSMQIVVQKLDSTGTPFFATNGIVLIDTDAASGLSPVVGTLGNNNIVVAWNAYSSTNAKWVSYYELDALTGASVSGTSPQRIKSSTTGTGYSRPYILPIVNNQYYLLYVKETGSFPGTTSSLYVLKSDSSYIPLWANAISVTSKTIPYFFFPNIISDGATGFTIAFNTSNPSNAALNSVYLQHLDSSGTKWSATGTSLTSSTSIQSFYGAYFHHSNNETWVALQVTDPGQSMAGNSLQRVDASGNNLSGTDGVVVDAQNTNIITPIGFAQNNNNGTIIYYVGPYNQQVIKAVNINAQGIKQWASGQVAVCATLSNKLDVGSTPFINHSLIVVWTDTRIDNGVYAQNLNDDGTLGPLAVGLNTPSVSLYNTIYENPSDILSFQLKDSQSGITEVSVYSMEGKLLLTKNVHSSLDKITIPETEGFSSGVYFVKINNKETVKWVKK